MKSKNINTRFLNGVLKNDYPDFYYHFGTSSNEPIMKNMINVKAVIICGSGERAMEFADHWSEKGKHKILKLKKEDRFVFRYCNQVIFASHGMGMPSASIALQELMKIIYFLKRGNLEEIDKVFWARVGTSGGVGLKGGSVILSTYSLMADLKPYRLLIGER